LPHDPSRCSIEDCVIPPSQPATRQATVFGPVKQGRRPPRSRLVLDRAEHGGIIPSGRIPTTQTNHPVTLLRCPSYWRRYNNTLADRSPYLFYQHCQKRLPAIGICNRSLRKTSFAKYVVRWKAEFRLWQPNHFNLCRSGGWSKGGLCRRICSGSFQRSTGTPDHLTERLSWPSTHLSQSSSFS
jgi:hypothetical protein